MIMLRINSAIIGTNIYNQLQLTVVALQTCCFIEEVLYVLITSTPKYICKNFIYTIIGTLL